MKLQITFMFYLTLLTYSLPLTSGVSKKVRISNELQTLELADTNADENDEPRKINI